MDRTKKPRAPKSPKRRVRKPIIHEAKRSASFKSQAWYTNAAVAFAVTNPERRGGSRW
jgi:hypothetical protein